MATAAPVASTVVVIPPGTATAVTPEVHPITGFVQIWGMSINPSAVLLAVIALFVLWALWKAQRDKGENTFNVWDLVMDTLPPTAALPHGGRKASVIKTCFMGAFLVSTWVVFDQDIKLSPQFSQAFTIYMATWGAALIAKQIWDQKGPPGFVLPQGGKMPDEHRNGDDHDHSDH